MTDTLDTSAAARQPTQPEAMSHQTLTPELRALRARAGALGAYVQQATHDTRETTRAAREAFNAKFLDQVDPKRELPEAERNRRAGALRKAYFARLSLKAQAARRVKAKRQAATSGGLQG